MVACLPFLSSMYPSTGMADSIFAHCHADWPYGPAQLHSPAKQITCMSGARICSPVCRSLICPPFPRWPSGGGSSLQALVEVSSLPLWFILSLQEESPTALWLNCGIREENFSASFQSLVLLKYIFKIGSGFSLEATSLNH